MSVWLEIEAWDPEAAAPVTLRATDDARAAAVGLGGETWLPALTRAGSISCDSFAPAFPGWGATAETQMELALAAFPGVAGYDWADRPARVYVGDAVWPQTPRFVGLVSGASARQGLLTLALRTDDAWADKPILPALYAGTGGAEGTASLAGQAKPLCFGAALLVTPVLLDPVEQIYQVHGAGPVAGIEAVLDRLARFGASFGDVADYATLKTLAVPAGRWASAAAKGLLKLGAPPEGPLTAIVNGDVGGGYSAQVGHIIRRMATLAGATPEQLDDASLAALDDACPGEVGLYLSGATSAKEAISGLAASCNAMALIAPDGRLHVVQAGMETADATAASDGSAPLQALEVELAETAAPYWRLQMAAEPVFRVHDFGEIAYTAELLDRGDWDVATTYREGDIVSYAGARWLYISPTPTDALPPPPAPATSNAWWEQLSAPIEWGKVADPDGTKPQDGATRNVYRGVWSSVLAYLTGDTVTNAAGDEVYVAIADVPAGKALSDAGYWSLMISSGGGAPGINSATVYLYQRTAGAAAPAVPAAALTYNFATQALSGGAGALGDWTRSLPAAGGPYRWMTSATAASASATDSIASGEWATPALIGDSAPNADTVYLYQRAASAPALPAVSFTYNFATRLLSGTLGSWSQTLPDSNGQPLWVTSASALALAATDSIAPGEWAAPVRMAVDGETIRSEMADDFSSYQTLADVERWWDLSLQTGAATATFFKGNYATYSGGALLECVDYVMAKWRDLLPYNPADLYEVEVQAWIDTAGTGCTLYCGLESFDGTLTPISPQSDGGSYAYIGGQLALGPGNLHTMVTLKGYFRGRAATGAGNGVGSPAPSSDAPRPLPNGTVWMRPVILAAYHGAAPAGGSNVRLNYVRCRAVQKGPEGAPGRDAMTYYQTTTPAGMQAGDTWYNPTTKIWQRYNGASWVGLLGTFAGVDRLTAGNRAALLELAVINDAYIGGMNAGKITAGQIDTQRLNINGAVLTNESGALTIRQEGVDTAQLAFGAALSSASYEASTGGFVPDTGTWANVVLGGATAQLTLANSVGAASTVWLTWTVGAGVVAAPPYVNNPKRFDLRLVTGGAQVGDPYNNILTIAGRGAYSTISWLATIPANTTRTYVLQASTSGGTPGDIPPYFTRLTGIAILLKKA